MGDYKLKTAKDYVVPESQRVNAEKKRIQLLNLLDQVNVALWNFLLICLWYYLFRVMFIMLRARFEFSELLG